MVTTLLHTALEDIVERTQSLADWLRELAAKDRAYLEQRAAEREANGCLSFGRLHEIVLRENPTVEEQAHFESCARCTSLRNMGIAEQWHLSDEELLAPATPAQETHLRVCAKCKRRLLEK